MTRKLAASILPLIALLSLNACTDPPGLHAGDARIRALIPGQDKTAGYVEISNSGDVAVNLIGAESAAARSIEFHTTVRSGDRVRMQRLDTVSVPAGATISFQPGSHHLMLFGVTSLTAETPVTLRFDDGRSLQVPFRTVAIGDQ